MAASPVAQRDSFHRPIIDFLREFLEPKAQGIKIAV